MQKTSQKVSEPFLKKLQGESQIIPWYTQLFQSIEAHVQVSQQQWAGRISSLWESPGVKTEGFV